MGQCHIKRTETSDSEDKREFQYSRYTSKK